MLPNQFAVQLKFEMSWFHLNWSFKFAQNDLYEAYYLDLSLCMYYKPNIYLLLQQLPIEQHSSLDPKNSWPPFCPRGEVRLPLAWPLLPGWYWSSLAFSRIHWLQGVPGLCGISSRELAFWLVWARFPVPSEGAGMKKVTMKR